MRPVYIHSVGINNALGEDAASIRDRIFSVISSPLEPYRELISKKSTFVGRVRAVLPELPAQFQNVDSRTNQLLVQAVRQIQIPIQSQIAKYGPHRVGVVLGTSTSGILEGESGFKMQLQNTGAIQYSRQEIGNCAPFLASYLGIQGPAYTISTACSSSKKAIASGRRLIQSGICDAVIVGGVDSLCELTLNGFDALESVSTEVCNPFSVNRDGINIGEGAAVFLISRDAADVLICGVGEASDGYHISAPDPAGRGAEIAIRQALEEARLAPQDMGYVNLHGTATPKNDEMESGIMRRIFGPEVISSSTKPVIGHTLGAAGAQELAFCYWSLLDKRIPPHIWDQQADPALPKLRFAKLGDRLDKPYTMSNSFAFGGNNASVVLGKA